MKYFPVHGLVRALLALLRLNSAVGVLVLSEPSPSCCLLVLPLSSSSALGVTEGWLPQRPFQSSVTFRLSS